MDAPTLKEVFTQQTGSTERSYAFESIFLLRIKYIGDKSRCTDSLFLNRNKYAECMQITGDENAYFTALVNGASTIYSPPSKFALYFAPYFTYGDVATEAKPGDKLGKPLEPVGKFLLNVPVYKETLLKGESPSVFKINTSSSKKKTVDTDSVIPFESSYVKDKGPLKTGSEVRSISNDMLRFILNSLDLSYFAAQLRSRNINEVMEIEDIAKKSKQQRDTKKYLDGYVQDYNEIEEMYNELKDKTLGGFVNEIKRATNSFNGQYYSKLVEQLENVFIDSRKKVHAGLFIALKGENTDGHKYLSQAFENGANFAIVEEIPEEVKNSNFVLVPTASAFLDCITFLNIRDHKKIKYLFFSNFILSLLFTKNIFIFSTLNIFIIFILTN
jgi:hypothetical protein